jgi:hypothetical protein
MENIPNAASSNTSNTPKAPEAEKEKAPRRQKPKLVKRSRDSFRPGSASNKAIPKSLNFFFPCGTSITDDKKMISMCDLAAKFSQAAGVEVTAVGIRNHAYEIVLNLQPVDGADDQLLSDTFRKLNATIIASAVLKDGFLPMAPPRWSFNIGDFVADEGGF